LFQIRLKKKGTPWPYYGLAVKTGSIALQKFILFILFFYLVLQEKVYFMGSIFFPDSPQKWDSLPFFFDILASFGVKNVCALFS